MKTKSEKKTDRKECKIFKSIFKRKEHSKHNNNSNNNEMKRIVKNLTEMGLKQKKFRLRI